ncbi:MAG: hypothetical protein ATN36_04870 [Epulopiscium sp. Nele67-Bin005]|nr:MAG: hypothetical protein ATN36_04870 [Epulopiscium sp. Nele67-Bin005]
MYQLKQMSKQVEGLEIADKIIRDIIENGLGNLKVQINDYKCGTQELGNYYIPNIQKLMVELLENLEEELEKVSKLIVKTQSLVSNAKICFIECIENNIITQEANDFLEEVGYEWTAQELLNLGLVRENSQLVQLNLWVDEVKNKKIEVAYWLDLNSGSINFSCNEILDKQLINDSEFDVIMPTPLIYYNSREFAKITWLTYSTRKFTLEDIITIKSFATDIKTGVEKAKLYFISSLSKDIFPVLISYETIGIVDDRYILQDKNKDQIYLNKVDSVYFEMKDIYENQIMFGVIDKNFVLNVISLVTNSHILRVSEKFILDN